MPLKVVGLIPNWDLVTFRNYETCNVLMHIQVQELTREHLFTLVQFGFVLNKGLSVSRTVCCQ